MSESRLHIRFFGIPSVACDGVEASLDVRPLCIVLLAAIVMAEPDRRVPRRTVAAELWPDDDETTAATKLRRHLSLLIAALPAIDDAIGRDRESVWHRASCAVSCDVLQFERGALELYEGEFAQGISHEWVDAHRERLRAIAVEGFVRQAEDRRGDDDYAGALASARRAIEIDPLHEIAGHLELELHAELGDLAGLDDAFMSLERRLREIDARPAPDTVALVERCHERARAAAARFPRPPTSFVEPERLEAVAQLVTAHRLVTIAGPGGAGKTRLALEVAHKLASTFVDGAYFADLSTVSEGDALSDALSRALGLTTDLASKGFAGIKTMLSNRRALLVLDNCEQIAESCAWFLSELMESAPRVHVVATTRETFGLRFERCYVVRPLSPESAARLFLDRARSAAWESGEIAGAEARIASMCDRLDRLPLAVELAAGMLGTLPLADVERQLAENLDHLRSRDPTAPLRHHSLHDVIGWSIGLLDEREREAFTRLAVFAGSFSADAARGVCDIDLAMLSNLVAKSVLLRADAVESRFVFLISIGQYARRLLEVDPQASALRDAHAAWYASLAMRSEETTFWKSERTWLRQMHLEFPNVLQALDWSLLSDGIVRDGLHLATGMAHYCLRSGFLLEGVSWLGIAIDRAELHTFERARASTRLCELETRRGHFEVAHARARDASATFEKLGDDRWLADALNREVVSLMYLARGAEAMSLLERALPLARGAGDVRLEGVILSNIAVLHAGSDSAAARNFYTQSLSRLKEAGDEVTVAKILNAIAGADYAAGRYDAATEHLERALAIHRDLGNVPDIAGTISDLGDVALMRGLTESARGYYAEALAFLEDREEVLSFPYVLAGIAGLALEVRLPTYAARLLGAATSQESGIVTPACVRVREHVRERVELALGDESEFEMRFGRALSRDDVLRLARSVLERVAVEA